MDNIIKIDLIDDTSKIDVELTDYNDKEVRDDIEELRQTKVDKEAGKGLSTNDYTTTEKNKLASLENYDDSEVRALIDTKQPRGNYITNETDPTVPNHVKNITQNNINTWNNKQNALISGTNIKTINEQSILGSGNLEIEGVTNYSELSNKPKINNVELNGNKTSSDLGLQPAGNYITKAVNDLENYYKKTETFTKQEVNDLISAISTLDLQVVQTLPTQDISTTTIYLVPKTTTETNDIYDEYIYVSNAWEHIGSTQADLTNYVENTDYANNTTAGVIRTSTNYGTTVSGSGVINASTLSYEAYTGANNTTFVGKGTLENVIEGKNLVNNTDYASSSKGGVIKLGSSYGTSITSSGNLRATVKTYGDYSSAGDYMFVGKRTLENVIAGKELDLKQLSTFDSTKTQVLKNINGTLTWVDE